MARGSFLVSRAAARMLVEQGTGGDIVYIVSKNAVFAGPNNVAYGSVKAAQAHQVRLLAAELGAHGIRVNGVQPRRRRPRLRHLRRRVGEGASRRLRRPRRGARPLLRRAHAAEARRSCPEHIAAAVAALVGGDLSVTTGTFIPVDGGIPAAFPR